MAPGLWQLCGLMLGGLIFGIALWLLKWDRFRGTAHVIVGANEYDGKLGIRDGIITAIADAIALGLGAPVGRYGPAVYFGATIGSSIGGRLGLGKTSVRILLGCGVAGAISASFNAPIAGIIFAHEIILGHFRLRAFAPITLASVAAVAITRFHHFEYIALKLWDGSRDLSPVDYPLYICLGLIAAGISVVYMTGILRMGGLARRSRIPTFLQPMIGAAIAGGIGIYLPLVLGLGDETLQTVLEQDRENLCLLFKCCCCLVWGNS